jgi:hypothetical protein
MCQKLKPYILLFFRHQTNKQTWLPIFQKSFNYFSTFSALFTAMPRGLLLLTQRIH